MKISILSFLVPMISFAADGGGHSHGEGGETEHLYPVLGVLALLIIGGAAFHFLSNRK